MHALAYTWTTTFLGAKVFNILWWKHSLSKIYCHGKSELCTVADSLLYSRTFIYTYVYFSTITVCINCFLSYGAMNACIQKGRYIVSRVHNIREFPTTIIVFHKWAHIVEKQSCSPVKGTIEWSNKHQVICSALIKSLHFKRQAIITSFNSSFDRAKKWLLYKMGSFLMLQYYMAVGYSLSNSTTVVLFK